MRQRLLVSAALVAAVLVGAAIVEAAPRLATLDPSALPPLPAQGLVVERAHDVVLVGLDGKPIGTLPGFAGPYTGKTYVLEGLAQADPAAILLAGPSHRLYVLDPAASRLRELHAMQIPLAGGAVLAVHAVTQPQPYLPKLVLSVVKGGANVVTPSQFLRVVAGHLVVTAVSVVDTVTGRRWRVPNTEGATPGGCEPAGVSGASLIAVCASGTGRPTQVRAYAISSGGARRPLGPTMRWGFGARSAFVSPDGRYVGITLDVGCGFPVGAIASLGAGHAGYLANGKPVGSAASIASWALGWTADGKLISHIIFTPTDCDHSPPSGIYAVDPATFARTLVYSVPKADDVAMWDATVGGP